MFVGYSLVFVGYSLVFVGYSLVCVGYDKCNNLVLGVRRKDVFKHGRYMTNLHFPQICIMHYEVQIIVGQLIENGCKYLM